MGYLSNPDILTMGSESSAFSRKFNGSVSGSASTLAVDAPLEPVFHLSVALK
jgi:hypothetical protein